MSGLLPGLAQLAAAGLVKAGMGKRPEELSKAKQPRRPRDTTAFQPRQRKLNPRVMCPKSNHGPGVKLI